MAPYTLLLPQFRLHHCHSRLLRVPLTVAFHRNLPQSPNLSPLRPRRLQTPAHQLIPIDRARAPLVRHLSRYPSPLPKSSTKTMTTWISSRCRDRRRCHRHPLLLNPARKNGPQRYLARLPTSRPGILMSLTLALIYLVLTCLPMEGCNSRTRLRVWRGLLRTPDHFTRRTRTTRIRVRALPLMTPGPP